jgi:hypothetical protein
MSDWLAVFLVLLALGVLGVAAAVAGVDSREGCDHDWW